MATVPRSGTTAPWTPNTPNDEYPPNAATPSREAGQQHSQGCERQRATPGRQKTSQTQPPESRSCRPAKRDNNIARGASALSANNPWTPENKRIRPATAGLHVTKGSVRRNQPREVRATPDTPLQKISCGDARPGYECSAAPVRIRRNSLKTPSSHPAIENSLPSCRGVSSARMPF